MKRAILACLIVGAAMFGMAAPALAHNVLVSSDPKDQTSLEAGPQTITLTFDQRVQGGENINTVTVVNAEGGHFEAPGAPTVNGTTVTAQVNPLGAAGEYTVGYRVLSADGHPVSGSLKFTLTKAGTGSPAPATSSPDSATPLRQVETGGGMPVWPWIIGAVVLLGGGVFLALRGGAKEDGKR